MRLGRLDSATEALQRGRGQGLIDGATLGGLCMETLKRMLRRRSGGRERAWEYFRCMQNIDAANVRHYTKMLQTCNDASEIDGLMAELDRSGIRPNAGTAPLVFSATQSALTARAPPTAIFTTLHKVYARLGMFAEAGNVLKTAQHKGLLDISGDADSKPFAIRILDSSTLSASALSALPVADSCFSQCAYLQSRRTHCGRCSDERTQRRTSRPSATRASRVLCTTVSRRGSHAVAVMLLSSQGRLAAGVMLDGCEALPSVQRWMAHMEKHQVARGEHT